MQGAGERPRRGPRGPGVGGGGGGGVRDAATHAVKVEDDIDRVDGARLVSHLDTPQNDLVEEARETLLDLGLLGHEGREARRAVDQVVVVDVAHVRAEVLEADKLALLLEELVVLGDVFHQDVVRQVDGALDVGVVRARHRAVDRLVRPRDERLVALDVERRVGRGVAQRLLVEDAEALVDRAALLLDLLVDGPKLVVQLLPVARVGGGTHRRGGVGLSAVDCPAHLVVRLERRLGERVALVGADVEDELVAVEEVVHLVDDHQDALAVRLHLVADLVVRERLLELVERRHKDLLGRLARGARVCAAEGPLAGGGGAELHIIVQQRHDVLVDPILLLEVEVEAEAHHRLLGVGDQVLRHEDDHDVLGLAAAGEVLVGRGVVRDERLAEQRQDHLGLARADLGEMEALRRRDDVLQEGLLLGCGHDLVLAVRVALILGEVCAEGLDELIERQLLVLIEVEELAFEDLVVVRVRPPAEHIVDGFLPGARNLDDLVFALDELEGDRGAPKVEEHQNKEGDVAHVDGHVEQVDELLRTLDLQE